MSHNQPVQSCESPYPPMFLPRTRIFPCTPTRSIQTCGVFWASQTTLHSPSVPFGSALAQAQSLRMARGCGFWCGCPPLPLWVLVAGTTSRPFGHPLMPCHDRRRNFLRGVADEAERVSGPNMASPTAHYRGDGLEHETYLCGPHILCFWATVERFPTCGRMACYCWSLIYSLVLSPLL